MVGEGKLAHTYVSLIEGKDFYGEVVENLNLDIGFGDFKENVEVSLVRDPEIIKIDVTDTNPELAANIANEMARVFIEKTEDFMEKKIQIVDGVEIEEEPTAPKLINEAYIAKNPVSPNPMLNMVIAGVVGVILGVFMAFILEFMDRSVKSSKDIESQLNIPVVGNITKIKDNKDLILPVNNLDLSIVESFRTIKTNIQHFINDREMKSIVITSAIANEGKATIASNLAITMAQENKKILLIDCDLRKPNIHKKFGMDNLKGLIDIIIDNEDINEVIHEYNKIENLNVITSGSIPKNPIKILNSDIMASFIREMEDKFDMVILNTPPVGVVADGLTLSSLADGVILVSSIGEADLEEV